MKVLLLHALPLDGTMWHDIEAGLEEPVLAPNLYQFGSSLEEWATAALDLAGAGPLIIVGNSVGGSCAIEIARLAPQSVKHLVLIGTKAGHRPEPSFRDEVLRVLAEDGVEGAWTTYWAPLLAPAASPDLVATVRGLAFQQRPQDVANGVRAFHGRTDRSQFLREWAGPVTVVCGQYDIAPEGAKLTAVGLRQADFQLVEGAGHYGPMERPDRVLEIVRASTAQADGS